MTRRLVLAALVGLLAAVGAKADDTKKKEGGDDAAAAMKKLEGNWKLTRKEYKGNLWPTADFRKEGLFIEDGKIFWTEDGKEAGQKGTLTIDAGASPPTIDVEITRGSDIGKKMLGIYELKGDKLTICWSDPGKEKRPTKFVTKTAVGAGTVMETYRSADEKTASEKKELEPKKGDITVDTKPDTKTDAKTDAKKLEGNWKLTRKEYKGNLWPSGFRKEGLFMEDGKISWTEDGKDLGQKGTMTIDPSTSPPSIDVEITRGSDIGKKLLGIYEIKGDKLTICWSEPGGEKRPTKFVTKTAVGAGTMLETYQSLEEKSSSEKKDAEAKKGDSKDDAKTDTKAEAKKLAGNWKLTRKEFKGNLWPGVDFRKEGLFIEDGKILWTEDGKERGGQKGTVTIDPSTSPPSIDVEITRGSDIGKKLLGIYEIKGDKLTICWSEPGGEKRPTKFVTKTAVGAGTTMETYQSLEEKASSDKKDPPPKKSDDKKADDKSDAKAEMKKLEGNWKLTRREVKGNLFPGGDFRKEGIFMEDGKIFWTEDGKEAGNQKGDLTLDPSTSPASIDVEITRGSFIGKTMLGIYEIKGDKLTICWSEPGGEKRPTKFVTKTAVGAGAILETYQKQKD